MNLLGELRRGLRPFGARLISRGVSRPRRIGDVCEVWGGEVVFVSRGVADEGLLGGKLLASADLSSRRDERYLRADLLKVNASAFEEVVARIISDARGAPTLL